METTGRLRLPWPQFWEATLAFHLTDFFAQMEERGLTTFRSRDLADWLAPRVPAVEPAQVERVLYLMLAMGHMSFLIAGIDPATGDEVYRLERAPAVDRRRWAAAARLRGQVRRLRETLQATDWLFRRSHSGVNSPQERRELAALADQVRAALRETAASAV